MGFFFFFIPLVAFLVQNYFQQSQWKPRISSIQIPEISAFFPLKKLAQQETTWVHEEGELSTKTHKLKKFG